MFGEDAGYGKRVMVIYNGVHYDALGVAKVRLVPYMGRRLYSPACSMSET